MAPAELIKLALLVACLLLACTALIAWWGDGTHGKRRCSQCGYDMANTTNRKCPECGFTAPNEYAMYGPRTYRRLLFWSRLGLLALVPTTIWVLVPAPWTAKVPNPILRLMLATTPDAAKSPAGLTAPTAAFASSKSPWERLQWGDQTARAYRDALEMFQSRSGSFTTDEVGQLLPAIRELRVLRQEAGSRIWREDWQIDDFINELVNLRQSACDTSPPSDNCIRLTWLLSELSYDSAGAAKLPRWAAPPAEVVRLAFEHPDPRVRLDAVILYSRLLHIQQLNPELIAPNFIAELELASADADLQLRTTAKSVLIYAEAFDMKPK